MRVAAPDGGDPDAPDSLNLRLAYAESLTDSRAGNCRQRLDAAQSQIDLVAASPAFAVVMPYGAQRVAAIGFRLHQARASCESQPPQRERELRAALDTALRAVELYRLAFDYQSMAVMQFDAAATYRLLGERANALAMLQAAIATDREFGFRQDAEDNAALLLRWSEQPADAPAAPMTDFPARSVTLKFAWAATDADIAITADYDSLAGARIVHSRGTATLARHIRGGAADWIVSHDGARRAFDFGDWPAAGAELQQRTALILANAHLHCPDLEVGPAGDFKAVIAPEEMSERVKSDAVDLIRALTPAADGATDSPTPLGRSVERFAWVDGLTAMADEDYALSTATWIDATLEQGVWYDMSAPLLMPGTAIAIDFDVQFAYARPLPCNGAASAASCVEILVHAAPNPRALESWRKATATALRLAGAQSIHYATATDLRIVTDPTRLLPYLTDTRRFWYIAIDGAGAGEPVIGSERVVSTADYH